MYMNNSGNYVIDFLLKNDPIFYKKFKIFLKRYKIIQKF